MDPYYDTTGGAYLAFLLVLIPIILIFGAIFYVISAFFAMKVFEKAGVEGKWRAWVPVYNTMVMGKLGDVSPWVVLGAIVANAVLSQIPVIGWLVSVALLVLSVMFAWRVNTKFGKEWYLLLLFLIPGVGALIWIGILGLGSARWNPRVAPAPWANTFIADKTVWAGIPSSTAGPAAPGAYPPPAGYQPPPAGYAAPPAGYQPPPAGYAAPPAGPAQPPAAPPVPPTDEPPAAPRP